MAVRRAGQLRQQGAAQPNTIFGSKAVREAIRDTVAAFGGAGEPVELRSPATPEAILNAIGSSQIRA